MSLAPSASIKPGSSLAALFERGSAVGKVRRRFEAAAPFEEVARKAGIMLEVAAGDDQT